MASRCSIRSCSNAESLPSRWKTTPTRGRSPASNIRITLLPGPDYSIVQQQGELDILPAGRSELVELTVAVKPAVDHFRVEFAIQFDDREANDKHSAFADRVHLLKPDGAFRPVPSPYAPGTPLQPNSSIFFGRQDQTGFYGSVVVVVVCDCSVLVSGYGFWVVEACEGQYFQVL